MNKIKRSDFEAAVRAYSMGGINLTQAGAMCGLSKEAFRKAGNKFIAPEKFGALPDDYFGEEDDPGVMADRKRRESIPKISAAYEKVEPIDKTPNRPLLFFRVESESEDPVTVTGRDIEEVRDKYIMRIRNGESINIYQITQENPYKYE